MMLSMGRIPGVGLAKGLSITLRHMLRKSVTQQYPEVKPALPPRSRGVIALVEENCTSCMLCARECPDWCIYIDSHKETLPAPEGGRPRQRNVLDRFAIDFSLCMYCGICIEVCPFDALFWSPEFEYAEGDIRNLLHEKDKLAGWVETVPPPPLHDPAAEPPKELTAAPRRSPRSADAGSARASRTGPSRTGAAAGPSSETAATRSDGPETPAEPKAGPPSVSTPGAAEAPEIAQGGPAADTPSARSGSDRPRRSIGNVRGIRPPGSLPPQAGAEPAQHPSTEPGPDGAPSTSPEPGDAPSTGPEPGDAPSTAPESGGAASTPPEPGDAPSTGPESGDAPSTGPEPGDSPSKAIKSGEMPPAGAGGVSADTGAGESPSTGGPSSGKLSTGSQEAGPEAGPEGQTSGARPPRCRMADPRSIRPPGRLDSDQPRESEEDS